MSTVCAISTPNAVGGISVIRISGKDAIKIAEKIFVPFSKTPVSQMCGHTCTYGRVVYNERTIDDAVLTVFLEPKSYTGENVAEISCHGGIFVTKEVLRACIESGAEPAGPGEFTKRAFLNGKLSLTQAEAVIDIISAEGKQALSSANLAHEGILFKKIKSTADELVRILAELAAWVDYPEEDLPSVENETLKSSLSAAVSQLDRIIFDYDNGLIFREGIDTAIVGRANVGKSSLMNMLLGFDRSIVTDVAGTTRDVIEESARLGEVVLKLSDTAGIRRTDDLVESMGVDLALKRLENARLIIAVFDASEELNSEDTELLDKISDKQSIIVLNKTDLQAKITPDNFKRYNKPVVMISAKEQKGKEELEKAVLSLFKLNNINSDATVFANERQKICVERAKNSLELALNALSLGETLDAVTVTISKACDHLLELTGEKATEAVVEQVFHNFCVGK